MAAETWPELHLALLYGETVQTSSSDEQEPCFVPRNRQLEGCMDGLAHLAIHSPRHHVALSISISAQNGTILSVAQAGVKPGRTTAAQSHLLHIRDLLQKLNAIVVSVDGTDSPLFVESLLSLRAEIYAYSFQKFQRRIFKHYAAFTRLARVMEEEDMHTIWLRDNKEEGAEESYKDLFHQLARLQPLEDAVLGPDALKHISRWAAGIIAPLADRWKTKLGHEHVRGESSFWHWERASSELGFSMQSYLKKLFALHYSWQALLPLAWNHGLLNGGIDVHLVELPPIPPCKITIEDVRALTHIMTDEEHEKITRHLVDTLASRLDANKMQREATEELRIPPASTPGEIPHPLLAIVASNTERKDQLEIPTHSHPECTLLLHHHQHPSPIPFGYIATSHTPCRACALLFSSYDESVWYSVREKWTAAASSTYNPRKVTLIVREPDLAVRCHEEKADEGDFMIKSAPQTPTVDSDNLPVEEPPFAVAEWDSTSFEKWKEAELFDADEPYCSSASGGFYLRRGDGKIPLGWAYPVFEPVAPEECAMDVDDGHAVFSNLDLDIRRRMSTQLRDELECALERV